MPGTSKTGFGQVKIMRRICLNNLFFSSKFGFARLAEEQDRIRLEEMSEDEYDALGDEEKAGVDKKRLEIKKQRIRK
jgi:hypothetical protein